MGQLRVRDRAGARLGTVAGLPATPRFPLLVAFVVAVAVAGTLRVWQVVGRPPLGWNDTADFVDSSLASWTSLGLWAGARPPAVPVILKVVGEDAATFVHGQAAFAVLCWAALAVSLATVVPGRGRWPAAAAVVAFSTTSPVTMWERSVLSESLALSLMALGLAAGLQVARGVTARRGAMLLGVAAVWCATRDSHASVVLLGGASALVSAAVLRARSRRADADADAGERALPPVVRLWTALGVGAVALALVATWGSSQGDRHAFPMRNVYEVRVLPYPDRVAWFADHGMPQAEAFLGPDARSAYREPGAAPVVHVGDDDPELGPWLDWVASDGRLAFARFVASHPTYLVTEPSRVPERAFNNAGGDRGFYAPPDVPKVPGADRALARPTTQVLLVVALTVAWVLGRRRWSPVLVTGSITAALAVPHGLLAWHGDGMETARHLVVPGVQLHLGALLMVLGAATAPLRPPRAVGAAAVSGASGGSGTSGGAA